MSTITPSPTGSPTPISSKINWVTAGCVLLLLGLVIFISASYFLYKISKKHVFTNISLWIGMILMVIGGVLLKHTTEVS